MSKTSKSSVPDVSDDSNSKSLAKSVTSKTTAKDIPKLEVLKVIAPKAQEIVQVSVAEQPTEEPVIPATKVIPKKIKITTPSLSDRSDTLVSQADRLPNIKTTDTLDSSAVANKVCLQPIPPATEPFQYRAIGVVFGQYVPTEENFSKGHILTADGSQVDAVLLGKIISIVKKRLDSDRQYLWVVYPRTNDKAGKLHVQISGVWAPVELGRADIQSDPAVDDGYFSIRGEVSSQSIQENSIIIKVRRSEQKFDKQKDKVVKEYSKFKVRLTGLLPTDAVGQFWSVNVQRQGDVLMIVDGEFIGIVPYKGKRHQQSKGRFGGGGKFAPKKFSDRPFKPSFSGDDGDNPIYPPRPRTSENRPPVPRPIIKRKDAE
ncbi:hypothetical protein HCU40_11505 [Pseudanabaena biceps]|nr:hypothetical protein [Pseudanabaena biceps]